MFSPRDSEKLSEKTESEGQQKTLFKHGIAVDKVEVH